MVMGVPTIKRERESYLRRTLASLIESLHDDEIMDCLIVVMVCEVRHMCLCWLGALNQIVVITVNVMFHWVSWCCWLDCRKCFLSVKIAQMDRELCYRWKRDLSRLWHSTVTLPLSHSVHFVSEFISHYWVGDVQDSLGVSASKMTYTLPCRVTHSLICLIWTFSWWVSFGKLICQIVITALYRNTLWHIKNFFSKLWPVLSNMQDGFLVCFHLLTVLWFSEGGWLVYQSHCRWNPNIVRHDFLSLFSISCIICLATFY